MSDEIKKGTGLTFGDKFKIVQFLGCREERLKTDQPSYAEVCRWVLDELKMDIKPTPLKNLCAETGLTWCPRGNAAAGGLAPVWESINKIQEVMKTTQDHVIALMQSQESIRAQLAEIRGAIATICKECGVKTTPGFMARNDAPTTSVANSKK